MARVETRRVGWARLTVWAVVNGVALLQTAGFATRSIDPQINRTLGWGIVALGVPATVALGALVRSRAGWRDLIGPVVFDAFVVLSLVVDHWLAIEFRDPRQPAILLPYLALFFGSIVLMGFPMYRVNRRLWLVTALSSTMLLAAMRLAMVQGVG